MRLDDINWNFNNNRGKLTFKIATLEIMDQSFETPKLKCHFSTDYASKPWWQMKLDQEFMVRSVKVFNLQNGAQSSNLEGATIFVGDTICGKLGTELPVNKFITVICQDSNSISNVFDLTEKKEFEGTKGTSIKIQALKPGVLVVCDIDIEIRVID